MSKTNWMARILIAALAACAFSADAATYYVDFDGGSDTNVGTTPGGPFKHSPEDPNATGAAASALLSAGDTVIFKGGVYYRGTIDVDRSGATGNPIVFDGNSAGTFGEGRAIIDGSEPVVGWTQCLSAAEANGNPNWASIYWAYIPAPSGTPFNVNLCEGDGLLALAQDPNPSVPFYQDRTDTYRTIRSPIPYDVGGQTHYVDATYFTQPDGYWGDDAYFAIYARTSRVYRRRVLDYIAAENKVIFELLGESQYDAGTGKFCMFNALRILDRPGEYYVKLTPEPNGMHKVFVWPYTDTSHMTISTRRLGFNGRGSQITIQGFIIQKQGDEVFPSGILCDNANRTGIMVRDNIVRFVRVRNEPGYRSGAIDMDNVTATTIDNNQIVENPGAYAIYVDNFDDSVVSNNYIYRAGASAVVLYQADRSDLIGNTLYDNRGMHANGLTVYTGCHDMLIEGNRVYLGGSCLALQDTTDVIIRNNVFDAGGSTNCISLWNISTTDDILITHNTLVNSNHDVSWQAAIYGQSPGSDPDVLTITNNILDGLAGDLPGTISYNLYTSTNGHTLRPGEILQPNMNALFFDPAGGDYHLLPTAAAVDAGSLAAGAPYDFEGRRRPTKSGYDMGAFEADELAADAGPDQLIPSLGGDGIETVTLDGSASRAPTSTITAHLWAEGATVLGMGETIVVDLPVGDHTVTLTVYDDRSLTNSDTVLISVASILIADAGPDQLLSDDDGDGFALVQLDGTGSSDPGGNITSYVWTDAGGGLVGMGALTFTALPVGVHTLTLKITNGAGEQAIDTVVITIEPASAVTPGDADGDGDVDLDDFVILKTNFGRTGDATRSDGDFDGDNDVDLDDFVILKGNFGAAAG